MNLFKKYITFFAVGCKFILRFAQNKLGFYKPYFAQWEITYRCNLKCVFCNIFRDKTYDGKELPAQECLKLLEELKKAGVLFINFTGGEPLLKEGFVDILRHAKKLRFIVTMNDNGLLLKNYVHLIKDYVDSIHISLDSHNQERYENLRGVKDTFGEVITGIKAAKESGMHVAVNMTVTRDNFNEIEKFCEFIKDFGTDVFFTIVSVIPTEFNDLSQSGSLKVGFGEYSKKIRQLKSKYRFVKTADTYLDFVEKGGFDNYRCLAARISVNVKPDGFIVLPCGYFPHFRFHGKLGALKKSGPFKDAVKPRRYHFCKDCTLSCFFIPASLMDIKLLRAMFNSYAFSILFNR